MISLRLDDDLLERLRSGASAEGRSLSGYMIWVIRIGLASMSDAAAVVPAEERPVPVGKAPKKSKDKKADGPVVLPSRRALMFDEADRVDMSRIKR